MHSESENAVCISFTGGVGTVPRSPGTQLLETNGWAITLYT